MINLDPDSRGLTGYNCHGLKRKQTNPTWNPKNIPSTHHNPPPNTLCLFSKTVRPRPGCLLLPYSNNQSQIHHAFPLKSFLLCPLPFQFHHYHLSSSDIVHETLHSLLIRGSSTPCHLPSSPKRTCPSPTQLFHSCPLSTE